MNEMKNLTKFDTVTTNIDTGYNKYKLETYTLDSKTYKAISLLMYVLNY